MKRSGRRRVRRGRGGAKGCFCAFCRSTRAVYEKKHVSFIDIGLCALTAALLSVIVWQDFDPRGVVFFAICLAFSELFIIFRWRMSVVCPHCGFDPVLYKRAPEQAARRVKSFMAFRRDHPLWTLSPPPKLPFLFKRPGETKAETDSGNAEQASP